MKKIAALLLLAFVFATACSSDDDDVNKGNTEFETTRVDFDFEKDSVDISVEGKGWMLENVTVDGVNFKISTAESREENNFTWLTVKCSEKNIRLVTTTNFDKKRDFKLQIRCADGSMEEITGSQKEALNEDQLPFEGEDEIHMSQREGVFDSKGGTFTIFTKEGSEWYFDEILLFDNYLCKKIEKPSHIYFTGAEMEDILYAKDEYFEHTIEWFGVKRNENRLDFTIAPNKSGKVRYFDFVLRTSNYECWFSGCQSAD